MIAVYIVNYDCVYPYNILIRPHEIFLLHVKYVYTIIIIIVMIMINFMQNVILQIQLLWLMVLVFLW